MIHRIRGLAFLALALPCAAWAADDDTASSWARTPQGELRLVSAVTAVGETGLVQLGLQFSLKPDWKIYWRSPGDAGLPPTIDWKGSANLDRAEMAWPAPHRFSYAGLETMGYKDEVVLPIAAHLADPKAPLVLHGKVDFLICSDICVPQHGDVALMLPAGTAAPSAQAHLISRFLARVPGDGALMGLSLISATAPASDTLEVTVAADPPLVHPDIFIERADDIGFGPPLTRVEDHGARAVFTLKAEPGTGKGDVASAPFTLTVVDGDRGMEVTTPIAVAMGSGGGGLIGILAIALLGGLILNLMPCVLPVLSLKLLALVGHGGEKARTIRLSFLSSAAGILVSFLALAGAAIAARAAGMAVGWGIQFQQPLFIAAMVALVTLFAANLFGFFEIPLPHWLVPTHVAHGEARSHAAHFLQGAFATLLATPCSAPFLGTAVGFALSRGTVEIAAVFAALGIGMALPFALVAAKPQLVAHLPRPGAWMRWLRFVLGLALIATALWLLGVLIDEAGVRAASAAGAAMAAALVVLGAGRRLPSSLRFAAALLLTVIAIGAAGVWTSRPSEALASNVVDHRWQAFDRAAIGSSVAAGKIVIVDVTADWCLTCKLNERAVFDHDPIASRLGDPNTVAMRADWTRPDPAIAAYLTSFGRYGIPFNVVYGPGAPGGIALPELLTARAVQDALARAAKPAS